MDKFKEKIRYRILFLLITLFIFIAIYLILFLNQGNLVKPSGKIISFHGGALTSFSIILILNIYKNLKALKDEKELKRLYIRENDERAIMILQKTGAIGINICICGFAIATIIAGYFSNIGFFILLGSTLFVALVKGMFKIYYHRKI